MRRLAVTSTAFSENPVLVAELRELGFEEIRLNRTHRRLAGSELVDFLAGCQAVVLGMDRIDGEILDRCRGLEVIAKFGVGLDNVDRDACAERGVEVKWRPGVNGTSVAEQVLAFMLMMCRNLYRTATALSRGEWNKHGGCQLSGRTIGIVGVGNVGKEIVRLLAPFGCRILANDIVDQVEYYRAHGLLEVSKHELYRRADIVTIHTPLTAATRGMIDREVFEMMKSSAFLINTARGAIVVEGDLKWALQGGEIAGAALDVYSEEPPSDLELLGLENLICTPHIGGNAREAVLAMGRAAVEGIADYLSGCAGRTGDARRSRIRMGARTCHGKGSWGEA